VCGAQLGQALALAGDQVVEHLAEPGGDGAQLGPLDAGGQLDAVEPLGDHLPRQVDVGAVLERHADLRQPEA
jgi:hypothetical protein